MREEVPEKVRNRVGLTRPGRALYEHDVVTHDRARNGELFGVGGFRKENRLVFTRGGGKLLFERGLSVVFGGVRGEGVR